MTISISESWYTRVAWLFTLSVLVAVVVIPSFAVANIRAAYGQIVPLAEYVGEASSCSDENHTELLLKIMDMSSPSSPLTGGNIGSWEIRVYEGDATVPSQVQSYVGTQYMTNPICFDPRTSLLQFIKSNTSVFPHVISPKFSLSSAYSSSTAGHAFVGHIHIKRLVRYPQGNENSPILSLVRPFDVTASSTVFTLNLGQSASSYGSNLLSQTKLYIFDMLNNEYFSVTAPTSVGVGNFSVNTNMPLLNNGLYSWLALAKYDADINLQSSTSLPLNWSFRDLPITSVVGTENFIYDSTSPEINSIEQVRLVGSSGLDLDVQISMSASDSLSGLATTTLYIYSAPSELATKTLLGALEISYNGETAPITTHQRVNGLVPGHVYEFVMSTTDVAENLTTATSFLFNAPDTSDLTLLTSPVIIDTHQSPPYNQIALGSHSGDLMMELINTGGMLVSDIGICWSDDLVALAAGTSSQTSNVACSSQSSVRGFDPGYFTFSLTNLNPNTEYGYYFYAANANNATTTQIATFTTLYDPQSGSSLIGDTVVFDTPIITDIQSDNVEFEAVVRSIGESPLSLLAHCVALSEQFLPDTPPTVSTASCLVEDVSTIIAVPHTFSTNDYFRGTLPSSSTVYIRTYASDESGNMSTSTTLSVTTEPLVIDFSLVDLPVKITYDSTTNLYRIDTFIAPHDDTNFIHTSSTARQINYSVTLENVTQTYSGTNPVADYSATVGALGKNMSPTIDNLGPNATATFTAIPPGYYRIFAEVNQPVNTYVDDVPSNNARTQFVNLVDPMANRNVPRDIITGIGPSIPDPGFEIEFLVPVIRSGESTAVNWDAKSTTSMNCTIFGPSSFGVNGSYSFNPAVDGQVGSIPTGELTSAQLFEFRCTEPISGMTFSTTTRINVVGEIREI